MSMKPRIKSARAKQPQLRAHLEGLAMATDAILKNCYPMTNATGMPKPVDLIQDDRYTILPNRSGIYVIYRHKGHNYRVEVTRV